MAQNLFATMVLQTVVCTILTTCDESVAIPNVIFGNRNTYNQTIDLSMILKQYTGRCYGFVTTIMYEKEGCSPIFKRNMICAGTCQSTVYPKDGGFKEFCQACQAETLIWERVSFSCRKMKEEVFTWIQIVGGCGCSEVSCGLN